MKFLKSILKGVKAAFRAMARVAGAPFAWLAGGGGDDYYEPEIDEIDERQAVVNEREATQTAALADARTVIKHAALSLIDDAPAPLPSDMSPALREWCRGLSRDECLEICGARPEAVSTHIQGVFRLPDVRGYGPLPVAAWAKEASPAHDDVAPEPTVVYAI